MLEGLRHRTARSGLEIIMVNVWESVNAAAEARNFTATWNLDGPVLLDETGEYAARLGIRGVPCNVFVDGGGQVRAVGATTPDELNAAADSLLAGDLPPRRGRSCAHFGRKPARLPGRDDFHGKDMRRTTRFR